jgi:hypothetical protein
MGTVRAARISWELSSNTPPPWDMAAGLMLLGVVAGCAPKPGGGMQCAILRQLAQMPRELDTLHSAHLLSAARCRWRAVRIQPA